MADDKGGNVEFVSWAEISWNAKNALNRKYWRLYAKIGLAFSILSLIIFPGLLVIFTGSSLISELAGGTALTKNKALFGLSILAVGALYTLIVGSIESLFFNPLFIKWVGEAISKTGAVKRRIIIPSYKRALGVSVLFWLLMYTLTGVLWGIYSLSFPSLNLACCLATPFLGLIFLLMFIWEGIATEVAWTKLFVEGSGALSTFIGTVKETLSLKNLKVMIIITTLYILLSFIYTFIAGFVFGFIGQLIEYFGFFTAGAFTGILSVLIVVGALALWLMTLSFGYGISYGLVHMTLQPLLIEKLPEAGLVRDLVGHVAVKGQKNKRLENKKEGNRKQQ